MPEPDYLPQDQGYMFPLELDLLRWIAEHVLRESGLPVLEIGSYRGLSASALTYGGRTICVDPWLGEHTDIDGWKWKEPPTFETFERNLRSIGRFELVAPYRETSEVFWREHAKAEAPFRVVLVDGSHTYDNALLDIRNAWDLLAPGGILVVDDQNWPEVHRAIVESGIPIGSWVFPGAMKLAYVYRK